MENFAQDFKIVHLLAPVAISSVQATDVINMSEYDKVTFVVETGTVGTGGGLSCREMDAVGDTVASESRLDIVTYWESGGAASDTYTKTSADSLSSYGGITIANADDSRVYIFEVRGAQLAEGNNCVALYFDDSTISSMLVAVQAICHPRYKQAAPPSAIA